MKKLLIPLLISPNLAPAAGLDWSAYDTEKCISWSFDAGVSENHKEQFKKKYGHFPPDYKAPPSSPSDNSHWSEVEAQSHDGTTTIKSFAFCFFSKNGSTVQCKGYGQNEFPLGNALFKAEQVKPNTWSPAYICASNCKTAKITFFYDHGWESGLKDHPKYTSETNEFERCIKKWE